MIKIELNKNFDQKYSLFVEQAKIIFQDKYSDLIQELKQAHIDLVYDIKKVAYSKATVLLVAYVEIVPEKEYRGKNKYWKIFSTKLMVLQKSSSGGYKLKRIIASDWAFEKYIARIKKHLLNKKKPHIICCDNINFLFLKIIFFKRYQKFPQYYHGKDLSIFYFIALLLFLALIMSSIGTWHPWYNI